MYEYKMRCSICIIVIVGVGIAKYIDDQVRCRQLPGAVAVGDTCLWDMAGGNMSAAGNACRSLNGTLLSFDIMAEAAKALWALNINDQVRCRQLPGAVAVGDTCLWDMAGGNMSAAGNACRSLNGTLLSFDSMAEAAQALLALNISDDTAVFTSATLKSANGSRFYDWLHRPGTWCPALDVYLTPLPGSGEQDNDDGCLVLVNRTLAASDCRSHLQTTVCEKALVVIENQSITDPETTQLPDMMSILDHVTSHVTNTTNLTDGNELPDNGSNELLLIPKNNGTMMITFGNLLELVANKSSSGNESETGGLRNQTVGNVCQNGSTAVNEGGSAVKPAKANPEAAGGPNNQTGGNVCQNVSNAANEIGSTADPAKANPQAAGGIRNQTVGSVCQNGSNAVNESGSAVKPAKANPQASGGRHTFISGLFSRNTPLLKNNNNNTDTLIEEVPLLKGGAIGIGSQAHPPMNTDSPPLHSPHHVTGDVSEFVRGITDSLTSLRQKTSVTAHDLQTFSGTFQRAVDDGRMKAESAHIKNYLLMDLLKVAEDLVNNVADPCLNLTIQTDAIEIRSLLISTSSDDTAHIDVSHLGREADVRLSKSVFEDSSSSGSVRVSTILFRKLRPLAAVSSRHISSTVMSVSVQHVSGNATHGVDVSTDNAIVFTMETVIVKTQTEDSRQCVFLNFSSKAWSTSGCYVTSLNSTHTTCSCNHLTSFAILVMYVEEDSISLKNQQVLFTLTTAGCSLSIACLAMTLITYFYLRMLAREKIMIHANLSLALLLAQLVFVSSGDAYKHTTLCKAVAVSLHFLFMAAFTWMLVEGVALYLCCTRGVFNQRDHRCRYLLLGWAPPVLIVVISVAVELPDYGNGPQYSCWLSVHNGLIWAFLGPMIVIVLLNMVVMGLVVKVFLTLRTNTQKTEVARFRGSVRAMMTLLPLLGLAWITSLLVPWSVVFHYLFIILNTVQGMAIFFFHCICNDEIRRKFREKTKRWSTSRTASEADVSNQHRRKTGSFDAVKALGGVGASPSSNSGQRSAWA